MQKAEERHDPKTHAEIIRIAERASIYFSKLLSVDRLPLRVSDKKSEDLIFKNDEGKTEFMGVFRGKATPETNEIFAAEPSLDLVGHEVSHLYYAIRHKREGIPFKVGQAVDPDEFEGFLKDIILGSTGREGFSVLAGALFEATEDKEEYAINTKLKVTFSDQEDPSALLIKEIDELTSFLSDGFQSIVMMDETKKTNFMLNLVHNAYCKIANEFAVHYLGKAETPTFFFRVKNKSNLAEIRTVRNYKPNVHRLERFLKAAYLANMGRLGRLVIGKESKERHGLAKDLKIAWDFAKKQR